MMKDEDVDELLRRRRYEGAFGLLLDRYQEKVFRLAFSILREAGRAEEVTQDIFLKLWKALPVYDGRASPATWLYAITRNTCYSASRRESSRKTVPIEDYEPPSPHETTLEHAEIGQLLERLPEAQREVITLFYLEDRSVHDVAQMLDLPQGTVKSHLHRARQALAEMMRSSTNGLSRCPGQNKRML
jgi:RNA polymerase sigma-70 factor (ECF subfamily)